MAPAVGGISQVRKIGKKFYLIKKKGKEEKVPAPMTFKTKYFSHL